MNRTTVAAAVLVLFVFANHADAQAIKVVKKPAPQAGPDDTVVYDSWWMSWGLRDDKDYTMGVRRFSTEAEARRAAQTLISSTSGNGEWAVTHVLIEGEASVRSKSGPTLPTDDRIEKDTLSSLQDDLQKSLKSILKEDVKEAFKKKNQEVKDAYRRAKEGKEFLTRNVQKIAEDDFKKVNGLISEYNGIKSRYAGEQPNGQYFASLPQMTPVTVPDVKRQADEWKQAQQWQNDLENEKRALDDEKARLDKERQDLIAAGRSLDQEQASVGDVSGLVGSEWEIPKDGNIFGLRIIEFGSDGELTVRYNVEASRFKGKWRSLGGNSYELTTRSGANTVNISGNQLQISGVKLIKRKDGQPDPNAQAKLDALSKKKNNRQANVADYKKDLAKYQQRLAAYKQKLATHKSQLTTWKDDQYSSPKNPLPPAAR